MTALRRSLGAAGHGVAYGPMLVGPHHAPPAEASPGPLLVLAEERNHVERGDEHSAPTRTLVNGGWSGCPPTLSPLNFRVGAVSDGRSENTRISASLS